MKKIIILSFLLCNAQSFTQETNAARIFWETLKSHCGNSYAGTVENAPKNDEFREKKLVMHVRSCEFETIRIPFFVGKDRSRTWILDLEDTRIRLKHDHRHQDGGEDSITQYGGTASNSGLDHLQVFPADQKTAQLLPLAATNVWWITLDETSFTYNLKRIGTERLFRVRFDLTKPVETPDAPWGWNDSE